MKRFIVSWLVNTVALIIVAHLVGGIYVADWGAAVAGALVLGLLNVFLRPLFVLLTLPITVMTLGLFTLVINGLMFYFASRIVPGFTVTGFWSAVGGALLFSIVSFLLNLLVKPSGRETPPQNARRRNAIDVETVPPKEKDDHKYLGGK